MRDWTYTELKTKVENDLDLTNEVSLTAAEWLGYFNEAIDEAEAEIHKLGLEDEYFLDSATLSLVTNTSAYAMPTNIYANKIRGVVYASGYNIYPVTRLRGQNKFSAIAEINYEASGTAPYQYFFSNPAASGRRINLIPPARETSSTVLTIWFIRNATRMTTGADVLDIPEFANFVMSFVKVKLLQKEGDSRVEIEAMNLAGQRKLMIDTLTEMVPDEDNEIPADTSHYEEHL